MADTFTTLLRLVLQETGGNQNVWGFINNSSLIQLLDDAIAGREDVDVTLGDQTLVGQNGADDPARAAILIVGGIPGAPTNVIVPSTSKIYVVTNETSPGFDVTIKTALGAGTVISPATRALVIVDATADDVFQVSNPPQATEDVQGIAEIATQAEVDAGTDDERFVTPLKLTAFPATNQATETVAGVAELADQAETDAGTDDLRIVTPLKLEGRQATEVLTGLMRFATQLEVDTGTETEAAVTPATLSAIPSAAVRGCKAYKTAGFTWPRNDLPGFTIPDNGPGGTSMIVDFNAEVFDTDTIHDNVTQNSRFTIPSGVTKVEFIIGYMMDSVGTAQSGLGHVYLRKNGVQRGVVDTIMPSRWPWNSDANGGGTNQAGAATGEAGMVAWYSGLINITDSDYLEVLILSQGGQRDTPTNGIWAEMRILG